jgi:hypothetical protein
VVIVPDVNITEEKIRKFINIYDECDVQTWEKHARKLNWHRAIQQQGGGDLLAGDMNEHSRRWNPRRKVQRDAMLWE